MIANGGSLIIVIRATHTQEVLGEQGRRIRELTSLIQKRFKFPENSVSLYAAKVQNRGLSAVAQCESLRYKLLNGLAVRRACYGVLRFIMESGAKGCEVVVSGKLRAARAKSMKFTVRLIRPLRLPVEMQLSNEELKCDDMMRKRGGHIRNCDFSLAFLCVKQLTNISFSV